MKKFLLNPKDNMIFSLVAAILVMTMLTHVFGIDGIWRFISGAGIILIIRQITNHIRAKEEADGQDE